MNNAPILSQIFYIKHGVQYTPEKKELFLSDLREYARLRAKYRVTTISRQAVENWFSGDNGPRDPSHRGALSFLYNYLVWAEKNFHIPEDRKLIFVEIKRTLFDEVERMYKRSKAGVFLDAASVTVDPLPGGVQEFLVKAMQLRQFARE